VDSKELIDEDTISEDTDSGDEYDEDSVSPLDIQIEIKSDLPVEIPPELPAETKTDTTVEIPSDIPDEVQSDLPVEIPVDIPVEIPSDIPVEIFSDIPPEIPSDIPAEIPSDIPSEIPADLPAEAAADLPADILPDPVTDLPFDIPFDIPSDFSLYDWIEFDTADVEIIIPDMLCAPCLTDDNCTGQGFSLTCKTVGEWGKFCLVPCPLCLPGYECSDGICYPVSGFCCNCGDNICDETLCGENEESCPADCCSPEVCNGLDDDCNGIIDDPGADGCIDYYFDFDGDGFGTAQKKCLCVTEENFTAEKGGDCDDTNKNVNPDAVETCLTDFDDNCKTSDDNALNLPDCKKRYYDNDSDGYYAASAPSECRCKPEEKYTAFKPGDCNDFNPLVYPDCTEKECGDDGCGGICGTCATGFECKNHECTELPEQEPETAEQPDMTEDIDAGTAEDVAQDLSPDNIPQDTAENAMEDAAEDFNPPPDIPPSEDTAEDAPDDFISPDISLDIPETCTPDCLNKNCGPNGCGGVCGTCDSCLMCDLSAGNCVAKDTDGDGFIDKACGGNDCDDTKMEVNPSAEEDCNTDYDDDCNQLTDELDALNCKDYYLDFDGDGFGHMTFKQCRCDPYEQYNVLEPDNTDCNDTDSEINPVAEETCDGIDNNCVNGIDEGNICPVIKYYCDNDNDTFLSKTLTGTCIAYHCKPSACSLNPGTDCDDSNSEVKPGAEEICDGIDNNCANGIDEGSICPVITYYCDNDADTFKSITATDTCNTYNCKPEECDSNPGTDCDDNDKFTYPQAPELCDGIDNNCVNGADEGDVCSVVPYYCDIDEDTFKSATVTGTCSNFKCQPVQCDLTPGTDCDDNNPGIKPGKQEICDGIDNNCADGIDEGNICPQITYYCDEDIDTFKSSTPTDTCSTYNCKPEECDTNPGTDCDDSNSEIYPGAEEICDGLDNNCVDGIDEGEVCQAITYYCDDDTDSFISASATDTCSTYNCKPEECDTDPGADCDDSNSEIYPEAEEICDGIDNNCADGIDEDDTCPVVPYYCDMDGDLFKSETASGTCSSFNCIPLWCDAVPGTDCNDNNDAVKPGATETCDGIDNNCAGGIDEGNVCPVITYYCDEDTDTFKSVTATGTCNTYNCKPTGCDEVPGTDCDDSNFSVKPGISEICDGIDNNCVNGIDEGDACPEITYYCDEDTDTFKSVTSAGSCNTYNCKPEACDAVQGTDCDDSNPDINPGAGELCDGIDNNCADGIDEGETCSVVPYFCDLDSDTFKSDTQTSTCSGFNCQPAGCSLTPGKDCNDMNSAIKPGAAEACDGIDNNCAGGIDEGDACPVLTYYCDGDNDTYVSKNASGSCQSYNCVPFVCQLVNGDDCDDENQNVNPGVTEICDGLDNNCMDGIDEGNICPEIIYYCDEDEDTFKSDKPDTCSTYNCKPEGCDLDPGTDCDDSNSEIKPEAEEICDGIDNNCVDGIDEGSICPMIFFYCDADNDTFKSNTSAGSCNTYNCLPSGCSEIPGTDCDDSNSNIKPGATEICDGVDNNCADGIDEDDVCSSVNYYCDNDTDTFKSETPTGTCSYFNCQPEGCDLLPGTDCNDNNFEAKPGAEEICDGIDNNCVDGIDEDNICPTITYYCDDDLDTFKSDTATGTCSTYNCMPVICETNPGEDCDDTTSEINPDAEEICDGKDNNCNDEIDEGELCPTITYYCDNDEDTFKSDTATGTCSTYNCMPEGCDTVPGTDCNDSNSAIKPGAEEICDGIDNNCAGSPLVDEGDVCLISYYCDTDTDGFISNTVTSTCNTYNCIPEGCQATQGTDCDDTNSEIKPGAEEICDGKDNNCVNGTDEGGICMFTFYCDMDSDGFISRSPSGTCNSWDCVPIQCRQTQGSDCDDQNIFINVEAVEICDGIDNNCAGDPAIDEGDVCPVITYYCDQDGDTYKSMTATGTCSTYNCKPSACDTDPGTDCADNNPDRNPGKTETCNDIDDNCDGFIDEENAGGCQKYYLDQDTDGYGLTSDWKCLCAAEGLYNATEKDDCNDMDDTVSPGTVEKCNNKDDDCDTVIDEQGADGCYFWCKDADTDGHGEASSKKCLCQPEPPWDTSLCDDCDDTNSAIVPGASEICDDKDNNCNGITDDENAPGCQYYYIDQDHDSYGLSYPYKCLCGPGDWPNTEYTGLYLTDCNDNDPDIHPGTVEKCDNKDNDCNDVTDEQPLVDCINYYFDSDGDGYGTGSSFQCLCNPASPFTGINDDDCDDINPDINPGEEETCNEHDDNCDGNIDDEGSGGCIYFYYDNDVDGFGNESDGKCLCHPWDKYTDTTGGDCDDENQNVYPDAKELCNNVDDDCNQVIDDGDFLELCGYVANGTPGCSNGTCTPVCNTGWYDLDLNYQNGCECSLDQSDEQGTGNTRETAYDLGSLSDTGVQVAVYGNIVPENDVDWYKVLAVDTEDLSCDSFHLNVKFIEPDPNNTFAYVIYREDSQLCTDQSQLTETDYSMNQAGYKSTPGQCPCITEGTGTDTPENNKCSDDSATYYIKVFKIQSGPTCSFYQLVVKNG
jgi:hypothetical protein